MSNAVLLPYYSCPAAGGVHSVVESLLLFLECLDTPIILDAYFDQCLQACNSYTLCKQVLTITQFTGQMYSHYTGQMYSHFYWTCKVSTVLGCVLRRWSGCSHLAIGTPSDICVPFSNTSLTSRSIIVSRWMPEKLVTTFTALQHASRMMLVCYCAHVAQHSSQPNLPMLLCVQLTCLAP